MRLAPDSINLSGVGMRRLEEDERHEHANLLRLEAPQRLFVQRWIELFDRDATLGVRCRPFWPDKVRLEMGRHTARDYHVAIMRDELSASTLVPLTELDFGRVQSQPMEFAQSLGAAVSALGFDHSFLFHAYKAMLYPRDIPFEERLGKLREWWVANSASRTMKVAFRTIGPGIPPAMASPIELVRWNYLPDQIRDCAQRTPNWWLKHQKHAERNGSFLIFTVVACDPDNAAAIAPEKYADYTFEASAARSKAIPMDDEWAFVDDSSQSPNARTYAIDVEKYRFPLRAAPYDRKFAAELREASAANIDLKRFWQSYSKARDDARAGNPRDALDHIAKGIDLAYSGYSPSGTEKKWNPPRLFVNKTAILLALDWCSSYYSYVLEYGLKPSYAVAESYLFGAEKRPEVIFDLISDDRKWEAIIARCDWDELLKFRRDKILQELSSLPKVLVQRCRHARWDLARAVRARNALFHRGEPLQDLYLLAIFLDAFDLILRLRVVAHNHGMKFGDIVQMAEQDYSDLTSGKLVADARLFATFGWRRWKSRRGDDIPTR